VYLAQEISVVVLASAVFMALGLLPSLIGTSTAIARRYNGRSGLALGNAHAGPGIGVPIERAAVESLSWRDRRPVYRGCPSGA